MFSQTIYPEGYNYIKPECSTEELMNILYNKMDNNEIVEGKLIYLNPDYSYGIIYFGSEIYGYIKGDDIRDFRIQYARCLLNQIINVKLIQYDNHDQKFICSRKEIIENARNQMDNYQIGYNLICKVLIVTDLFILVDIGHGRTVKIPDCELNSKKYEPGDIDTFTIKSISKSRISKHQIISLTKKNIGDIIPVTFKYKNNNRWFGEVENNNNYPLGEIQRLHQNATYEKDDCHVARIADYADDGSPIYKLL